MRFLKQFFDGLFMKRDIILHRVPDIHKIDLETFGDDPFSDARHACPVEFGMFVLKFSRDAVGGFPNDFDLVNDRVLHHGSRQKFTLRHAPCVAVYLFHGGKDMIQVNGVIAHGGPLYFRSGRA